MNTTIKKQPKIPICPDTGIDPRCRFWYIESSKQESVQIFPPSLIYATKIPSLSSLSCQRLMVYNKTTNQEQLESVACLELRFNHTQNYFQNYVSSTKQVYFIEPQSQILLYDSKQSLGINSIETLQSKEFQYLQSQNEAIQFNETINKYYGNQLFMEVEKITQQNINQVKQFNQTFSYNRNGTQTIVIMNPVYVADKRPQFEGIKRNPKNKQYQIKTPYVQINIISNEDLKQHAEQIDNFFKTYFLIFNISFGVLGLISFLVIIYYTIEIKDIFYNSINDLTLLLVKMNDQDLSQDIFELLNEDEQLSLETYELYQSFKLIYQIMLQSSEDYYKENETKQLLKLNKNIEFFKQFGNLKALGTTLNNIGSILLSQGHYFQALEHFQSSVVYAKCEIQQFCNQNPNTLSYNILQQFCYIKKNENDLNSSKPNKSNTSQVIKATTSQFFINNKERESVKINEEKSRFSILKIQGSNKKCKENSQTRKTYYTENNLVDELKEERTELLTNLYYRKKNYVFSLLSFQEFIDSQNEKSRIKQMQFNFWLEIKRLCKSLLIISKHLNQSELIEIEIKALLSKCYFKLKQPARSEQILYLCKKQLNLIQIRQQKSENISFQQKKSNNERKSPQLCCKAPSDLIQKSPTLHNKQKIISFSLKKEEEEKNKTFNLMSQSNQFFLSFHNQNQTNQKFSPNPRNESPVDSQITFPIQQNQQVQQLQQLKSKIFTDKSNFRDLENIFEIFRVIQQDQQANEFFKQYYSSDNLDLLLRFTEAEFLINQQQFKKAAEILTKIFEEKRRIISHYFFKVVQALDNIFVKLKMQSKDITQMKKKLSQDVGVKIQMIFSSDLGNKQIIQSLQLTSNLVSKIQTQEEDQIGINYFDFSDKWVQTYMPLTQTLQIKKCMGNIIKDILQGISNPNENDKLMELIQDLFEENEVFNLNSNNLITSKIISYNSKQEIVSRYQLSQQDLDLQLFNFNQNQFIFSQNPSDKKEKISQDQEYQSYFNPLVQFYFDQSKQIKKPYGDQSIELDLKSYELVMDSNSQISDNKTFQKQNHLFHFFIRKSIIQFMNQQLITKSDYLNQHPTEEISNNLKYIIYCADSIQIFDNQMFKLLCKLLITLKIKLIIYSKQQGNNFIEQQPEQIYVYQNHNVIRVFYDTQQILNYFDNTRNKFNKNIFPTIIQSY